MRSWHTVELKLKNGCLPDYRLIRGTVRGLKMARRKTGLSADRHIAVGERLDAIREELTQLSVEVSNAYPRTGPHSKFAQLLNRTERLLSEAQSVGDGAASQEHRTKWCAHWYYRHGSEHYGSLPHKCGTSYTGWKGEDSE